MSEKPTKKIVLTGGPCAGKTTLTQVIARTYHHEVASVPEAASLLFSGGFPRWAEPEPARSTQRAIYRVQCELESAFTAKYPAKTLILDRSTVDGAAYWPDGSVDYFTALGTSLAAEKARYDRVIYLETASPTDYLAHASANPKRTETWEEAHRLDMSIRKLWAGHPGLVVIESPHSFSSKIKEVLAVITAELKI